MLKRELLNDISLVLIKSGIDVDSIKSQLIIILDKYEINKVTKEIIVYNEDDISKYIIKFICNN